MSKKSKLKGVATPPAGTRSVATRLEGAIVDRIEAVAKKMTDEMGTTFRKANVFEICVTTQLPVMEKRYGITPAKSAA
jgi:hypothetical protein